MADFPVFIIDSKTHVLFEATVRSPVDQSSVDAVVSLWSRWKLKRRGLTLAGQVDPTAMWNWAAKVESARQRVGSQSFVIIANRQPQGIMLVDLSARLQHMSEAGKAAVYVSYLETAPWNRIDTAGPPRFFGVGTALIMLAAHYSWQIGRSGRLVLHSLKESEPFYRKPHLHLAEIGPDSAGKGLVRFELTSGGAKSLLDLQAS